MTAGYLALLAKCKHTSIGVVAPHAGSPRVATPAKRRRPHRQTLKYRNVSSNVEARIKNAVGPPQVEKTRVGE